MAETSDALHASDIHQISELMQALERSGFDSLQIETRDIKLALSKGSAMPAALTTSAQAASTPPAALAVPPVAGPIASASTPPQAHHVSAAAADGLITVTAPIMGQFYKAPDPSSPPFVQIGSPVEETTTLGLIEVMKVFNAVAAGAKGTIAEICVNDAQTIEMGQVLFRIRPH